MTTSNLRNRRIRRNQSRIEFLANKEAVVSLLEQGFDKKRIFERFQKKDAFSMSYSAFCRICAKMYPKSPSKLCLPPPADPKPALPALQENPVPVRSGPQILGKMEQGNPASPSTYMNDNLTI